MLITHLFPISHIIVDGVSNMSGQIILTSTNIESKTLPQSSEVRSVMTDLAGKERQDSRDPQVACEERGGVRSYQVCMIDR
jgi:hypothetical protein